MKKIKITFLTLVCLLAFNTIYSQKFGDKIVQTWYSTMAKLRPTPWVVGLGWNIVDDNGNPFHKFFQSNSLIAYPFPNTIRAEKYVDKGWSGVFNFSYNDYKAGKLINSDLPATSSSNFMSFDLNAKYNFCELYDINKKWFHTLKPVLDLYATSGLGYTYRNTSRVKSAGTFNFGFGTHIWIYEGWGLNLQAVAKFGLKSPFLKTPSNYLQYSFGAVRTFKLKRVKTAKHSIKAVL